VVANSSIVLLFVQLLNHNYLQGLMTRLALVCYHWRS